MNFENISNDDKLKEIKSDYFVQIIFNIIKKNKSLDIMKYNKKLQNRLNLTIDDYIKFSQLCSSIKIELKLINNKYGTFINIPDREKKYYHIYFGDSKEEIKRNYLYENEKVNNIQIIVDYQVNSFKELFKNLHNINSIYFKAFFRNNIKDMSYMFSCCSVKELNISNFITDNVNDMNYMFGGCSKLKELDISKFNTKNVSNMSQMFIHCGLLKNLNLSNFNTNKVNNMSAMFYGCSSLKNLNLYNFDTINVNNMSDMFYGCLSLNELNITNFNTKNVLKMNNMFYGCSSLKELNL